MKLLFENWREYLNEQEFPEIVQIFEKEVEEAAALVRELFALNKQLGEYYKKAPEKNEREASAVELQLIDKVMKPFEDKEEELEALVDAAADLEPPDPEKFIKAIGSWNDHVETIGVHLRKVFTTAQENGVQISKPYVKFLHDNVKSDLEFARQSLKNVMQDLEAAKQGNIGTAATFYSRK